jgi:hypothetical protein
MQATKTTVGHDQCVVSRAQALRQLPCQHIYIVTVVPTTAKPCEHRGWVPSECRRRV